ncbi:S-adenosyl-L-methionine-dependent methyltransferase [Hypoxylon sp. FL1857]|nr:S-adenosyl-L-methionine-dependent methyltransferase [Hypoxylon sp. FL1857]
MFRNRNNARSIFTSIFCRPTPVSTLTSRTLSSKSSKTLDKDQLQASSPLAEELASTGVWAPGRAGRTKKESESQPKADKSRLNIVSEKLCDDILSYIGSSLNKHKGCDILDIYPGAGLWSRKLHDYLQPRSHILMEPDADLYKPFLKPLLDRPNTTLVPASGLIWRELNSILTPEYLPHQIVPDATRLNQRNDTLLVTANIAFHPKKRFLSFDSLASLVLYQFIESIRTSATFQRYGLVRMLVWARHDDKYGLLPKVMQKRKKLALDSELSCEWVREVCGHPLPDSLWYVRDGVIDASSSLATWKRMRAAKMKMPEGRASEALKEAQLASKTRKTFEPGSRPPVYKRTFQDALNDLEAAHEEQVFTRGSDSYKNMKTYRWRANWEDKKHERMYDLLVGLEAIHALYKSGTASPAEIEALEAEWEAKVQASPKGFINEFITWKDNLHYYRQDPPLLHWDRRAYDPMVVQPEEFFPNIECSLLDIQPKETHPLLRQRGPDSNRAGDCFDLITSSMMSQSTVPVSQCLDALMPGAADYIMPRWKSTRDLDHGGIVAKTRYSELTARLLNARQWEELIEIWMEWPFRPELHELIARTNDELAGEDSNRASDK